MNIKGIGEVKAITLLAAIELGKRLSRKVPTLYNKKITSAELVYDYYNDKIGDKKQEYFYCLYLDNRKRIIKEKLLFIGTINYSVVHPREIFKEAYLVSASTFICVHNHPSGNAEPSKIDIDFTNQLVEVGNLLGIPLIDHVIIGVDKYFSFFENKK